MLHCPTCGKHYPADFKFCPADQTPLQADATVSVPPPGPLIGQTLDEKYRLEQKLGVGGMGSVYRARHILIDRAVAVKVLHPRLVDDDAARIRFEREAQAAGRLQHLNAVAVTDFGKTVDGHVYIVMELLEGHTLREILAREAPLETARAVSMMLQISAAVAAAHEAGIIHRDLKPANILVTQSADVPSIVKVLDFGIAKLAADTLDDDDQMALTQIGVMIGTPRYMSPEQCDGLELTPAADVYSLGVILYEMLTGSVPFSGSSPLAIAIKHANDPPRPPREIVASIPDELQLLVLHALEKHPEERPRDAAAFRTQLLETAERLGLEHHALISTPDIDALREAGRESPSGRLVVDLSRVRETRALTSGSSELTVVGNPNSKQRKNGGVSGDKERVPGKEFSRVDVNLPSASRSRRKPIWLAVVAIALLGSALAFLALRTNTSAPMSLNVNTNPSPTPVLSPSPTATSTPRVTPSPSPGNQPSPSPSPSPSPDDKKKKGKVGSIVNKVKRILTKPF